MNSKEGRDMKYGIILLTLIAAAVLPTAGRAQETLQSGHEVEWVYRVRPGFTDEWWRLFRTWEIPVLDEQKKRGIVLRYEVQQPEQHSSEEVRWDYRVIVTYRDRDGPFGEESVARTLFPDTRARSSGENRRWELTTNHWDLPFHVVDPHGKD